jgi:hypothetical protein
VSCHLYNVAKMTVIPAEAGIHGINSSENQEAPKQPETRGYRMSLKPKLLASPNAPQLLFLTMIIFY